MVLRDLGFTVHHYLRDLEIYLSLMDEFNNCVMSASRREGLEYTKAVLEVVLDMYELDHR